MIIDTHIHTRDFNEAEKETISHALEVAKDSGISAIFAMPNTQPATIDEEMILAHQQKVREANIPEVLYGVYFGITPDIEQVKQAVALSRKYHPFIVGGKIYLGHSTNNLGVIKEEDQYKVLETLASEGYNGVLFAHAEKESCISPQLWNQQTPISHCIVRSEQAELDSVNDLIKIATETKLKAKIHVAHISSPAAVNLVNEAKQYLNISCGVTFHHLIYDMNQMLQPNGILWKMNPPLRQEGYPNQLLEQLRKGEIDWIETDHAPHTLKGKLEGFASGIPALPWWPVMSTYLHQNNFTEQQIEKITYNNAAKRFQLDIPKNHRPIKDRRADYPFNPFEKLEQVVNWHY